MTLFFSIARLLLWPLQDVLINNLRNVMEIFPSSSAKFLLLQYIFFVCEAAKCRWGEERVSIQFYEFMTGTLNKRRWSLRKNLWMKFISWEIFDVRFFWDLLGRDGLKYTQLCKLIFIIRNKHTGERGKICFLKNPLSATKWKIKEWRNSKPDCNIHRMSCPSPLGFWISFSIPKLFFSSSMIEPDFLPSR